MSQGKDRAPGAGGPGHPRSVLVYLAFVLFGAGSAWFVVGTVFLELAAYEDELGLLAPNRASLGYQAGALCAPLFAAMRICLQRCGREVNYKWLIVAMAFINLVNLAIAALGIHSLETLMLVAFLGGGCGYLSGTVHQAYLVTNCDDVYSAAWGTGDAAAGALAAVLALIQRPELGKEGRNFSPGALYCMLMPLVLMSLATFLFIDHKALGFLPEKAAQRRPNAGALLTGELELSDVNAARDGSEVPSAADVAQAEPQEPAASAKQLAVPPQPEALGRGLAEVNPDPGPLKGVELEDGEVKALPATADSQLAWMLPAGAVSRPGVTAFLLVLGFWMSFTCWGIGDSVIPYACQQSSVADDGKDCLFHSSLATVVAILVGSNLAGIPGVPAAAQLVAPGVCFSVAFCLLCLAAAWGGRWAQPLAGPAASSVAAGGVDGEANGGGYIILLVVLMRSLQPFVQVMRQRLIQTAYEPEEREDMNLFFFGATVAANICGVIVVTVLLS